MLSNYDNFLFNTREECCKEHYHWDINECMGNSPDDEYAGTEKWYVDWDTESCIQDCAGESPCGGIAEFWDELYSSKEDCCNERLFWKNECMGESTSEWYVKYGTNTCVQDCVGESPCGGNAQKWDELYSSKVHCCDEKLWWVRGCLAIEP